jgi:hypothetical protein
MSPEQAAGAVVGPQSDIFSLGVVAYEMFTQSRPFEGSSYSEVLEKIQTQATPLLTHSNPLIQPSFEGIVSKMLEKDTSERYANIVDVITDIERAMEEYEFKRDRRRLKHYILDPEGYEKKFNEKMVSKCLSQGTFYMRKGKSHLNEAVAEFKRILFLDPTNERARVHLSKIMSQYGNDATVTLDNVGQGEKESKKSASTKAAGLRKPRGNASTSARTSTTVIRKTFFALSVTALIAVAVIGGWWGWTSLRGSPFGTTAPVLSSPSRLTVTEGQSVEFSLNVIAPDGDSVRVYCDELPAGAALTPDGEFSWNVTFDQEGTHELNFYADDGNQVSSAKTVIEVVDKALALEFTEPARKSVRVGRKLSVKLQALSALDRAVSFSLGDAPAGMTVSGDHISWTPRPGQAGTHRVPVYGTDGVSEATRTLVVDVAETRQVTRASTGRLDWAMPIPANFFINGEMKAKESSRLSIELPTGSHAVRAELLDGGAAFEEVVNVRGGSKTTLETPAIPFGRMSVYFLGGVGEFYINGRRFDHQPPFTAIDMPAGEYVVACAMFREEDSRQFQVSVHAGQETIIEYEVGSEPVVSIE